MVPNIQTVDDLEQFSTLKLDSSEPKRGWKLLHELSQLFGFHVMLALWVKLGPSIQEIRNISALQREHVSCLIGMLYIFELFIDNGDKHIHKNEAGNQ